MRHSSVIRDRLSLSVLVVLVLQFGVRPGEAQNDSKESESLSVESRADQLPIFFNYLAADEEKLDSEFGLESAPVVILIHGAGEDHLVWENKPTNFQKRPMTKVLHDEGFAVVAVDMRGSGESVLPDGKTMRNSEYPKMIGDLEAVKAFLMEQHQQKQLNINKLGIVAADDFAPIALQYASFDWQKPDYDDAPVPSRRTPRGRDVRALALLSPSSQLGAVSAMKAMVFLKNPRVEMAVFIGVGSEDPADRGLAARIARQFGVDRVEDDLRLMEEYNTRLRGTKLVGAPKIRTDLDLRNFLVSSLKEPEVPWRNRESRISR